MLKTLSTKRVKPKKGGVGINNNGKNKHGAKNELDSRDKIDSSKCDSSKFGDNKVT